MSFRFLRDEMRVQQYHIVARQSLASAPAETRKPAGEQIGL
jgi:hypothetical protein